jgi:hypothetical protein
LVDSFDSFTGSEYAYADERALIGYERASPIDQICTRRESCCRASLGTQMGGSGAREPQLD